MKDLKLPQQLDISIIEEETPTVVVNGQVQQTRKIQSVVLQCPVCHEVTIKFPDGVSVANVYRYLGENDISNKIPKYCLTCGTEIYCDRQIVSEQDAEVIKSEVVKDD